ncbi:GGDEF domain-containing protein [Thiospirochaeta perfilievii]|uniref:GGDEF domain-containing protein n=1 Tax=Thiospirochaeta perfilievii TaxID=252967 RepID=A0A5C1QAT4_9SPIO|nr:GGDEF domain-containing protein [Thiospirochaeta perfilievii]QEN04160.1 GGDEF domain-containing protein [Thiospirochaeta perfilievii]
MIIYITITFLLMILTFFITRFFYITKLKKCDVVINDLTTIDKETGLYNRHFFDYTYLSEFHRASRINCPLALVFFKSTSTDKLPQILLDSIKRDTDFISRYEKNIYAAVLYDTSLEGVDQIINRVMERVDGDMDLNIGVHTSIPDSHTSSIKLVEEAIKSLNVAISRGDRIIEFTLNSI